MQSQNAVQCQVNDWFWLTWTCILVVINTTTLLTLKTKSSLNVVSCMTIQFRQTFFFWSINSDSLEYCKRQEKMGSLKRFLLYTLIHINLKYQWRYRMRYMVSIVFFLTEMVSIVTISFFRIDISIFNFYNNHSTLIQFKRLVHWTLDATSIKRLILVWTNYQCTRKKRHLITFRGWRKTWKLTHNGQPNS